MDQKPYPSIPEQSREKYVTPEQRAAFERAQEIPVRVESQPEPEPQQEERLSEQAVTPLVVANAPHAPVVVRKDNLVADVEAVLEDGLGGLYKSLDDATKREFKVQGEKTASAIVVMMRAAKVQVRKVAVLIISWLKIVPGISSLFIEQEAKIKTDEILALRERGREDTE